MEYTLLSYTAKSDLHTHNEDAYFIGDDFLIIADGMGGESDGDIASRIAVGTIGSILSQSLSAESSESDISRISAEAIYVADAKISEYVDEHPDSFGMGTTVLLAVVKDDKLHISWCVYIHCYIYKDGIVHSLTKDHSYIQELIDSGQISVEESFRHLDNNLITRYVGGGCETCIPDCCMHPLSGAEIIILCSDGLSGYCKHDDIAKAIKNAESVDELPRYLADLALRHGSDDDITVVTLITESYIPYLNFRSNFRWLKTFFHS